MNRNSLPTLTRRQAVALTLGGAAFAATGQVFPRKAYGQGTKPVRIGVLNDQNGPYSGVGGPGSVAAARLAIEEFGGRLFGRTIEVVVGNHQNRPELGASIAREWLDNGVSAIADGASSAVGVAIQTLAREKNRTFLITGCTSADLYGRLCSPSSVQWITDTYASSFGTIRALMEARPVLKKWYTMVVDYTAGHDMERNAATVVASNGGAIAGTSRFPLGMADFSSILLQAQSAGAQAIALGTSGPDAVNCIKQFHEFGLEKTATFVTMLLDVNDLQALGPASADGLIWATNFYWDRDDASREWTRRFRAQHNQLPTRTHASTYAAVLHYLRAAEITGSDDGGAVVQQMRAMPASDPLFTGVRIREDGKVLAPLYLIRSKAPTDVKHSDDWGDVLATLSPDQAYRPMSEGGCVYLKT